MSLKDNFRFNTAFEYLMYAKCVQKRLLFPMKAHYIIFNMDDG